MSEPCKHGQLSYCSVCAEHAVFRAATERRKQNGIRLKRFCILAEGNAVASMNSFYSGWVESIGKEKALDLMLMAMRNADERLRAALQNKSQEVPRRVQGKAAFLKVSAPRLED